PRPSSPPPPATSSPSAPSTASPSPPPPAPTPPKPWPPSPPWQPKTSTRSRVRLRHGAEMYNVSGGDGAEAGGGFDDEVAVVGDVGGGAGEGLVGEVDAH